MSGFNTFDVLYISDQIEKYLNSHPYAADTVEGITQWWLPEQGIEVPALVVQQALDYLQSKSIIKCNVNFGGSKVYSSSNTKNETG